MIFKKFNLICYLFFYLWIYTLPAFSQEAKYPYEKCNWKNEEFTARLVRESQDFSYTQTKAQAVCIQCTKKMQQRNRGSMAQAEGIMHSVTKASDMPEVCFLAATLRGSSGKFWNERNLGYYYCPSANTHVRKNRMLFNDSEKTLDENITAVQKTSYAPNKRSIFPHRPCLNEDYIKMTAKAFNETANCFGYHRKEDKKQLFALMNHESAFLLNKKPKGNNTARCYGQIKNGIVSDLSSYVRYGIKKYHNIYKKALKRCPYLESKTVNLNNCQKYKKMDNFKRCFKRKNNKNTIKCKTSQDAYSCLFYAIFNMKRNEVDFKKKLSRTFLSRTVKQKMKSSKKLQEIARDFKHPVTLNELVTVKGTIIKNGKKKQIKYVFKDMSEIFNTFNKPNVQYRLEDLTIKKVKLFNQGKGDADQKLKWAFLHLAHNGGTSIIVDHFTKFITDIKSRIANASKHGKIIKRDRRRILSGESLDFKALSKKFSRYANWASIDNKAEVTKFIANIEDDLKSITSSRSLFNKINRLDRVSGLNTGKAHQFVRQVGNVCPKKLF